jgi:hypothetical protein
MNARKPLRDPLNAILKFTIMQNSFTYLVLTPPVNLAMLRSPVVDFLAFELMFIFGERN